MPLLSIMYPNERFGSISLYINDILVGTIEAGRTVEFEVYKGINTIRIKRFATNSKESVHRLEVVNDQTHVIEGYFSNTRMRIYFITYSILMFAALAVSYFLSNNFFSVLLFALIVVAILAAIIHAVYYVYVLKKPQVYLVPLDEKKHRSAIKKNIKREYTNRFNRI